MSQLNKIYRSQGCNVLIPFDRSCRVSSSSSLNLSIQMKQKRLQLLNK